MTGGKVDMTRSKMSRPGRKVSHNHSPSLTRRFTAATALKSYSSSGIREERIVSRLTRLTVTRRWPEAPRSHLAHDTWQTIGRRPDGRSHYLLLRLSRRIIVPWRESACASPALLKANSRSRTRAPILFRLPPVSRTATADQTRMGAPRPPANGFMARHRTRQLREREGR